MEPTNDNNNNDTYKNRKNHKNPTDFKTNQQKKIEKKLIKQQQDQQAMTLSIKGSGIKLPNKISESITFLDLENLSNNVIIQPGVLPNNIKKIKFGRTYDCELLSGSLPNGLLDLTIGKSKLQLSVIPNSVTNLSFSDQFYNEIIPGSIPNSVTSISFGNSPIGSITQPTQTPPNLKENSIPSSVTYLDIGGYNCLLESGVLPNSIKILLFGKEYNRELSKGSIPDSVTHLTLSHVKFTSLESIPPSVVDIKFQDNFNKPIERGILESASSLETLTFGRNFNSTIVPLSLPISLKSIIFGYHHNQIIKEHVLPNGLTSLELGYSQREKIVDNILPKSLTSFKIYELYGIAFDYNPQNDKSVPSPSSLVPCNNSWRDVLYDKGYNLD